MLQQGTDFHAFMRAGNSLTDVNIVTISMQGYSVMNVYANWTTILMVCEGVN